MATNASHLGSMLLRHIGGRLTSTVVNAFKMLNVATDGTQEATKFILNDSDVNQGVMTTTELHIGSSGSETQITATAKEINQGADLSSYGEDVIATRVLTVDDNGKVLFLNATNEFVTTLPLLNTITGGFHCKIIITAAPSGVDYTLVEDGADSNKIILNGIAEGATTTGNDGPSHIGFTTLTFATGAAIAGDWVDIYSDGTSWFVNGYSKADAAFTTG